MKLAAGLCFVALFLGNANAEDVGSILEKAGIDGGLIVVVGCDDPTLLDDLHAAGPYLVHGLVPESGSIEEIRKYLIRNELNGTVPASQMENEQLPFVDELVNLIIVAGARVLIVPYDENLLEMPNRPCAIPFVDSRIRMAR